MQFGLDKFNPRKVHSQWYNAITFNMSMFDNGMLPYTQHSTATKVSAHHTSLHKPSTG